MLFLFRLIQITHTNYKRGASKLNNNNNIMLTIHNIYHYKEYNK